MSHIRITQRRTQEGQEVHVFTILTPRIVVQQTGTYWLLGIEHIDSTSHVPAYYPSREAALRVAKALAEQYATADLPTVTDYVKLAKDVVAQYADLVLGARKETP